MASPRGSVLFIAYHFPPSGAVGGQRIARFASAIRELDWHPEVLTIADENIEIVDAKRLKDVEGIAIHKARVLPTLLDLLTWAWTSMRSRGAATSTGSGKSDGQAVAAGPGASVSQGGIRRFVMSMLLLPDGSRGWLIPASITAVRTIRARGFDWFMTSCPPYSTHLVGVIAKMFTGARWAVDFRDPWMTTGSKRLYPTSPLSMSIERWLERKVIEKADLVLFNVERLRDAYRERYSYVPYEKFVFIPNGLVRRRDLPPPQKFDVFTITYTGSLYVGRSPEPVLAAAAQLIQGGRLAPGALKIRLVGQCSVINGMPTETVVRKFGLESVVEVSGPVPYEQAFQLVRNSHLALLLAPNLPYQIPAKVYDYLAAGTRILAIAEEGGTSDMINATASGRSFRSDEVNAIADFIVSEYERVSSGLKQEGPVGLERYDVARTAQDLVSHFDRVSTGHSAPALADNTSNRFKASV
jgi:hypothetical protein